MPADTLLQRARSAAEAERTAVDAKVGAFESFIDQTEAIQPAQTSTPSPMATTAGKRITSERATSGNHCRTVRTIFEETIRPRSVADLEEEESLLTTIRNEFTDSIALALAPTTTTSFTPELKHATLTAASNRQRETVLLCRSLDRELGQLADANERVDEVVEWISDATEPSLLTFGFDELRARHETLAQYRSQCSQLASSRQEFLQATSNHGPTVSLDHRALVQYLYDGLPVDYPVLSAVAQLDSLLRDCQRAVRNHLVRRV